ncbi:peptidoglycan recognition protein family protein, partial [Amaricoccus solimangrovi]
IGVALCGMVGAVEAPFSPGLHPINELQLRAAAQLVADLCGRYGIPVTPRTVLTHAEVQPTLGIAQRGKWDIARLPWRPDLVGPRPVGDYIRQLVLEETRPAAPIPIATTGSPDAPPRPGLAALILAALRGFFGPKGA